MTLKLWLNSAGKLIVSALGHPVLCETCPPCGDVVAVCTEPQIYPKTLALTYQLVYRPVDCGDDVTPVGGDTTVTWTTIATYSHSETIGPEISSYWTIAGAPHVLFACGGGSSIAFGNPNPVATQIRFNCPFDGGPEPPGCWFLCSDDGTEVDFGSGAYCFSLTSTNPLLAEGEMSPATQFWECIPGMGDPICYTGELTATISGAPV